MVGSGNARSGVVHRDGNGAGRTGYDDTNRFTSRADSARVVQQIRDDLADPGGIDGRSRGRPLGDQRHLWMDQSGPLHLFGDDPVDVGHLEVQTEPGVDAR